MENTVLLDIHKITNKIMFIYKALEDGWTVVKIDTDKYEFSKKFDNKDEPLDDVVSKFINSG